MVLLQLFLLFQLLQFFLRMAWSQWGIWGSVKLSNGYGTTICTPCKFDIYLISYRNGNLETPTLSKCSFKRCHGPLWFWPNQPRIRLVICKIPRHLLFPCQLLFTKAFLLQLLNGSNLKQKPVKLKTMTTLKCGSALKSFIQEGTIRFCGFAYFASVMRQSQTQRLNWNPALLLRKSPCKQLQLPFFAELHLLFASEAVPAKIDVPHGVSSSPWLLHSKDLMLHFALMDCTRVQSDRAFNEHFRQLGFTRKPQTCLKCHTVTTAKRVQAWIGLAHSELNPKILKSFADSITNPSPLRTSMVLLQLFLLFQLLQFCLRVAWP